MQGIKPNKVKGLEWNLIGWQPLELKRQRRQGGLFTGDKSSGQRVAVRLSRGKNPVDHQILPSNADGRQLLTGSGNFVQGCLLGTGDKNQASTLRVSQRINGSLVLVALLLQARQWAKADADAYGYDLEAA